MAAIRVEATLAELAQRFDLHPSSFVYAVYTAREAGAAGVSVYDSGGLTDAHLAALRGTVGA